MDSITEFIKEERDVLYLRGQEKIIESLLVKLNYSLDQIADIAGVSVDFVRSVKQRLTSKL
jgi:DNA-binding CsgD family transcriptional regulator